MLKKLLCVFNWHKWGYLPLGTTRKCEHCNKCQHLIANYGENWTWED